MPHGSEAGRLSARWAERRVLGGAIGRVGSVWAAVQVGGAVGGEVSIERWDV